MTAPSQYDLPLAHKIPRRWWEKYAHRLEREFMPLAARAAEQKQRIVDLTKQLADARFRAAALQARVKRLENMLHAQRAAMKRSA